MSPYRLNLTPSSHSAWPSLQPCEEADRPQPAHSPQLLLCSISTCSCIAFWANGYLVLTGHRAAHHFLTGTPFPSGKKLAKPSKPPQLPLCEESFFLLLDFLSTNHSKHVPSWETPWYFLSLSFLASHLIWDLSLTLCNLYVLTSLISATLIPKLTPDHLSSFHGPALWYELNTLACFILKTYSWRAEYVDEKVANQHSFFSSPAPWK